MTLQELFPDLPIDTVEEYIDLTPKGERYITLKNMAHLLPVTRRTLVDYIKVLRSLIDTIKVINGIRYTPSTVYILKMACYYRRKNVAIKDLLPTILQTIQKTKIVIDMNLFDISVNPILRSTPLMSFIYKKRSKWNPLGWFFWVLKI